MKKLNLAVAAAAIALLTSGAALADNAPATSKTYTNVDSTKDVALHAQYTVKKGSSATNSVFTTKLNTSSSAARPIGYFTVNGLTEGVTYELSPVTASGSDSANVSSNACFLSAVGDATTTCNTNNKFIINASSASPAYVQVDHNIGVASEGETFINLTMTAYTS
ncbi:hypothetical protein K5L81_002897 [Salmonella enterica]|nr:hypothetical protein [Salmonella enterica]EHZ2288117.1 hypothetical protein [Salmonella enterica]